jgi:hypothetical protein
MMYSQNYLSGAAPGVIQVTDLDRTRERWSREQPNWRTEIQHATKRKRLGLSLHLPLGTKADRYLDYMNDLERARYCDACESLAKAKSERAAIVSRQEAKLALKPGQESIVGPDDQVVHECWDKQDLMHYKQLGANCEAAIETIWELRREIIERTPAPISAPSRVDDPADELPSHLISEEN